MDNHETKIRTTNIKSNQKMLGLYGLNYIAEIKHTGLNESETFSDFNKQNLDKMIKNKYKEWDLKFQDQQKQIALNRTKDAKERLAEIDNLLINALNTSHKIDWLNLKRKDIFVLPNPKNNLNTEISKLKKAEIPIYEEISSEPKESDSAFTPEFNVVERSFNYFKNKKVRIYAQKFELAYSSWIQETKSIEIQNTNLKTDYDKNSEKYEADYQKICQRNDSLEKKWLEKKQLFFEEQKSYNANIDLLKTKYLSASKSEIINYCELVLNKSQYPASFPKKFAIDYNISNKILIIDYSIPIPENMPTLAEVKYIAARKELIENHINNVQRDKMYDTTIYNIALRTMYEIFDSDTAKAIMAVNFNGWVNFINKATGKKDSACIISIQTTKALFSEINIAMVDPKECFKSLKGVGSSRLSGIVAIQPILQMDKADKRIVSSRSVEFDSTVNLAAMDWEDFEHLIRELFEKEFTVNGGEVKVTQASRDGGVDAIAFDPDPIRGGKIVIQAKRYTNVVGVSAVRDLFGTVMNEGATKGILVTTADYGPDSYAFAKGKPLTLLNGSNLLHLLEKHGQKARIDIKEARKTLYNK